jgi:3-oxoadipate enol-lactonase
MQRDATQVPDRGGRVWRKDRQVASGDGTTIRYTVRGRPGAPWLVFAAGFMCPDNFWQYVAPLLFDRYRCVFLDYRSIGASDDPRRPGYRGRHLRADDYTIERHADDVAAVIDTLDARGVTVIGHSMGCQVALATWRSRPQRVAALALITGPYASPLHTFYGSKLGARLFPVAAVGLPVLPRPVQKRIGRALRLPIAMPVARLIRALGPETPAAGMQGYFEHFGNVDPLVALAIASGMHDFDAGPWLGEVDVPTLVVVGTRDTFTPPEVGEVMLERIPDAELVEVRGGTHGALIEYPGEIHDAFADFVSRRLGHDPAPRRGDATRLTAPRRHP